MPPARVRLVSLQPQVRTSYCATPLRLMSVRSLTTRVYFHSYSIFVNSFLTHSTTDWGIFTIFFVFVNFALLYRSYAMFLTPGPQSQRRGPHLPAPRRGPATARTPQSGLLPPPSALAGCGSRLRTALVATLLSPDSFTSNVSTNERVRTGKTLCGKHQTALCLSATLSASCALWLTLWLCGGSPSASHVWLWVRSTLYRRDASTYVRYTRR